METDRRELTGPEDNHSAEEETAEILRDHPDLLERLERIRSGKAEFASLQDVAEQHGVSLGRETGAAEGARDDVRRASPLRLHLLLSRAYRNEPPLTAAQLRRAGGEHIVVSAGATSQFALVELEVEVETPQTLRQAAVSAAVDYAVELEGMGQYGGQYSVQVHRLAANWVGDEAIQTLVNEEIDPADLATRG